MTIKISSQDSDLTRRLRVRRDSDSDTGPRSDRHGDPGPPVGTVTVTLLRFAPRVLPTSNPSYRPGRTGGRRRAKRWPGHLGNSRFKNSNWRKMLAETCQSCEEAVETCPQCATLREMNNQMKDKLIASQRFAQECEDEAVDLRRQLCTALKDLAKARKIAEFHQSTQCRIKTGSQVISPTSSKKADIAHAAEDVKKPVCSRREGLRSCAKHALVGLTKGLAKGDSSSLNLASSTSSPMKRKADISEAEEAAPDSVTKRHRTDEMSENVEQASTLEEALNCIKDISAGWNQRICAIQRIRDIMVCSDEDSATSSNQFERIFLAFSVQVLQFIFG